MKRLDITGQVFGRLTAIKRIDDFQSPAGHKLSAWLVRCSCGTELKVRTHALRNGNTKSCGCLQRELSASRATVHGSCKSRLYRVWAHMVERCTNPNAPGFRYYGARGIGICDEWRYDFTKFQGWAALTGYDDKAPRMQCTIDRIDNNGNYEPGNCRWVTMKEQQLNKRPRAKDTVRRKKKKVYCVELDTVFESVDEAKTETGASEALRKCCNFIPRHTTSGGYHWRWANGETA